MSRKVHLSREKKTSDVSLKHESLSQPSVFFKEHLQKIIA